MKHEAGTGWFEISVLDSGGKVLVKATPLTPVLSDVDLGEAILRCSGSKPLLPTTKDPLRGRLTSELLL